MFSTVRFITFVILLFASLHLQGQPSYDAVVSGYDGGCVLVTAIYSGALEWVGDEPL
jgi:hypothetical protein